MIDCFHRNFYLMFIIFTLLCSEVNINVRTVNTIIIYLDYCYHYKRCLLLGEKILFVWYRYLLNVAMHFIYLCSTHSSEYIFKFKLFQITLKVQYQDLDVQQPGFQVPSKIQISESRDALTRTPWAPSKVQVSGSRSTPTRTPGPIKGQGIRV